MRTITTSGIYKITQISTGLFYIGSSISIEKRWNQHRYTLNREKHGNRHLLAVFKEHGFDDFLFEIVEACSCDKVTLLEREQHYIDTLRPAFNIAPKAGSRLGSKATESTKLKMSQSMMGKNVGKVRSDETKEKLRAISLAMSPDVRKKIGDAQLGSKKSDDTKERMRAAKLGVSKNPDSIAMMLETKNQERLTRLRAQAETSRPTVIRKNDVRHTLRKLSDHTIRDIRNSGDNDKTIASKYNCSPATIRKVRTGVSYRDVF